MACGVPVLSTDCDYGAREILAPKTDFKIKAKEVETCEYGFLMPPFNMDDIDCNTNILELERIMGDAIMHILSLDNNFLISKGLKYVRKFDNEAYGKYWKETIEEIINA